MVKFHKFKERVKQAQNCLPKAAEPKKVRCLSTLSKKLINTYDHHYCHFEMNPNGDNETIVIKEEPQDVEDMSGIEMYGEDTINDPRWQTGGHNNDSSETSFIVDNIKTEPIEEILDLADDDVEIKEEPLPATEDHYELNASCNESILNNSTLSRSTNDERQRKVWEKSVLLVYHRLCGHKYGSRFMRPVSDDLAPGYSRIVKRPIDLTTIRKKIKAGLTSTTAEFQRDLLLMVTNALMYNCSQHNISYMAKDLLDEINSQMGILTSAQAHASLSPIFPPVKRRLRNIDKPNPFTHMPASKKIKLELIKNSKKLPQKQPSTSISANRGNTIVEKKLPVIYLKRADQNDVSKANITKTVADLRLTRNQARLKDNKANKQLLNTQETFSVDSKKGLIKKANVRLPNTENIDSKRDLIKTVAKVKAAAREKKRLNNEAMKARLIKEATKLNKEKLHENINCIINKKEETNSVLIQNRDGLQTNSKCNVKTDCKHQPVNSAHVQDLAVAITTVPRNDITKEQAIQIKKSLENTILAIALDKNSTKFAPNFRDKPIITDGVIKLWCDDERSLRWLKETVGIMSFDFGKLIVKKQSDLPWKVKSGILIPGIAESDVILSLLRVQNPWADVSSWIVYSVEQQGDDTFLISGIPNTIIPQIMGRERRLAYSLGSVFVNFFKAGVLCDVPPV